MKPNWRKWNVGDKVPNDVLVFVVRNGGEGRTFSYGVTFPVLVAGCSNASGTELGWKCKLGETNKVADLISKTTRLTPKKYFGDATIPLFDPKYDDLYYTEDTFLDLPDIVEGRSIHISFERILRHTNAPNICRGGVVDK